MIIALKPIYSSESFVILFKIIISNEAASVYPYLWLKKPQYRQIFFFL